MNKLPNWMKTTKHFVLIVIIVVVGCLWYMSYNKIAQKKAAQEQISQIPDFEFGTLAGDTISLNYLDSEENTVIIYFNTHCDFCQFELEELEKRISDFEKTHFLLVSAEPMDILKSYAAQHSFNSLSNVDICRCSYQKLNQWFGKLPAPSIFIYDPEGQLIKHFKEAVKIDDILSTLENHMLLTQKLENI